MSEIVISAADIELRVNGLGAEMARALLALRTDRLREGQRSGTENVPHLLAWTLGTERFALPLGDIAMVLPAAKAVAVPDSPKALLGLVSRRGQIINVVDPAPALGLVARAGEGGHLIVLRGGAPRFALLVDRAEEILALPGNEDGAHGPQSGLTVPTVQADGGRLSLVDRDRLIEAMGFGRGMTGRNDGHGTGE